MRASKKVDFQRAEVKNATNDYRKRNRKPEREKSATFTLTRREKMDQHQCWRVADSENVFLMNAPKEGRRAAQQKEIHTPSESGERSERARRGINANWREIRNHSLQHLITGASGRNGRSGGSSALQLTPSFSRAQVFSESLFHALPTK